MQLRTLSKIRGYATVYCIVSCNGTHASNEQLHKKSLFVVTMRRCCGRIENHWIICVSRLIYWNPYTQLECFMNFLIVSTIDIYR